VAAVLFVLLAGCAGRTAAVGSGGTDPIAMQAPDVLDITCDGTSTIVATSQVQAQPEGVQLTVHNTSSRDLQMGWDGANATVGEGLPPGDVDRSVRIWPGEARFRCQPDGADPGEPDGWIPFTILEPAGWVDPSLGCSDMTSQGTLDYAAGARGVDDPVADAQEHAPEGTTVMQAGYVANAERTVIGITDGVTTRSFTYRSDGRGGWLLSQTGACG
jgi:hypothetical protein